MNIIINEMNPIRSPWILEKKEQLNSIDALALMAAATELINTYNMYCDGEKVYLEELIENSFICDGCLNIDPKYYNAFEIDGMIYEYNCGYITSDGKHLIIEGLDVFPDEEEEEEKIYYFMIEI